MNNRIDELAKLATTVMFDGTGTDVGKQVFDRVKFAELIIKECMLICRRHPSRNLDNSWDADAVAPHLVQLFEEHFGVEE